MANRPPLSGIGSGWKDTEKERVAGTRDTATSAQTGAGADRAPETITLLCNVNRREKIATLDDDIHRSFTSAIRAGVSRASRSKGVRPARTRRPSIHPGEGHAPVQD